VNVRHTPQQSRVGQPALKFPEARLRGTLRTSLSGKPEALEEGAEKSTGCAAWLEKAFGKLRSGSQRRNAVTKSPVRRSC
jgi:hypothetical protein